MSRLWTVGDVAVFLGVPVKTLYEWRTKGYGPKGRRVGKHVRYKPEDVIAWFESLDHAV
ncbi:helix-turn-helix transcriptional regulator [Amycolatopsis pigmentata]|uniref:Helix-turn-helix transcriptional regulator n=1 Tax=Amycolatopsis pigmentata TaxID=450801 RepID=A0ABW5FYL5_9PSEU